MFTFCFVGRSNQQFTIAHVQDLLNKKYSKYLKEVQRFLKQLECVATHMHVLICQFSKIVIWSPSFIVPTVTVSLTYSIIIIIILFSYLQYLWALQPPLCCRRRNLFAYVWWSQGHLGGIAHWPHPVVVRISKKLFFREETVSWYAHFIPYRVSRPFWCCFMRTLYKFCGFVSGRHCRYFEGKFRSLAVLFYALLNWNHRMQAT